VSSTQRLVLGVEYLGNAYHGWQRQSEAPSVQAVLEGVLSEIANHNVEIQCAGRTDSGVHATAQHIHFDIKHPRPEKAWLKGANSLLPDDISVYFAKQLEEDFHARFTATERTYVYLIQNTNAPRATLSGRVTRVQAPLQHELMHQAAQSLIGEQNFSAFRSAHCQSHTAHRNVTHVSVKRSGELIAIEITANAFLHHMVRNIVGSLIEVGSGRQSIDWIADLISKENRCLAGATASPYGLYLCAVGYPAPFGLSNAVRYPLLMANNF